MIVTSTLVIEGHASIWPRCFFGSGIIRSRTPHFAFFTMLWTKFVSRNAKFIIGTSIRVKSTRTSFFTFMALDRTTIITCCIFYKGWNTEIWTNLVVMSGMVMPFMAMSFMVVSFMVVSFMVFIMIMPFMIFVWSWTKNFIVSTKYRAKIFFMNAKIWFRTISNFSKTKLFFFGTFYIAMIVTSRFMIMSWHTRSIATQNLPFTTCPSTIDFRFESRSLHIAPRKSYTIWLFGAFNSTIIS